MSGPPPAPPILNTSLSLVRTLTDFLTVATHTLLSARSLYPSTAFLTARAYNLPVQQCRHPAVCTWINDSIAHLTPLLLAGSIHTITIPIFSPHGQVLERYLFDISRFPIIPPKERFTEFEFTSSINQVDLEEQLRATIKNLQIQAGRLKKLPGGPDGEAECSWTIVVELREDVEAEPPIGHPMPWVASEPGLQLPPKGKGKEREGEVEGERFRGKDLGGVKSTPVRLVEAGGFVMEAWIEEGRAKFEGHEQSVQDTDEG